MLSIIQRSGATAAKVVVAIVAVFAVLMLFTAVTRAGVGVGVAPSFPSTVNVGDNNVAVSMDITNNSNSGDGNPLTLNSIKIIPSCGAISGGSCTSLDPGVFNVDSGTGANACAGRTFTSLVTNVGSGEVTFTPDVAIALTPGQTCTINFTVDVIGAPDIDASVNAGLQTLQLGLVDGVDQLQNPGTGTGSDSTTVNKASPSIATQQSAGGPIGTVLNDTATLTGGLNPTGSVTFKLFPPSDATCSGAPAYTDVDPSAPYATSPGFASNASGVWHWTADYAGDASNNATSSGCMAEPVTIDKLNSTVTTTIHSAAHTATTSVLLGTSVHDNAVVSGGGATPTGSVSFSLYSTSNCSGATTSQSVALAGGSAESSATTTGAGGLSYKVFYGGDANYNPSVGICEELAVTLPPPPPAGKYCSPGYWKQPHHFDSWVTYTPTQKFSTVFGVAALDVGKNKKAASDPTLVEALNANGGGINVIMRKGVDALLNSTAFNPWSFTSAQVIAAVQQAVNTNNPSLLDQFDLAENCPLN
jgi:hypothetical protein